MRNLNAYTVTDLRKVYIRPPFLILANPKGFSGKVIMQYCFKCNYYIINTFLFRFNINYTSYKLFSKLLPPIVSKYVIFGLIREYNFSPELNILINMCFSALQTKLTVFLAYERLLARSFAVLENHWVLAVCPYAKAFLYGH